MSVKINIDQCDSSDKKNQLNKISQAKWESLLDSGKSEPAWEEDEDQLVSSSVEENSPGQFMGVE